MALSSAAAVGLQLCILMAVGLLSHRLLSLRSSRLRIALGLLLTLVFTVVDLTVLPPPPPGPQGADARHVVAFLLSGSFFLVLTRLLSATLVGLDGLGPQQGHRQQQQGHHRPPQQEQQRRHATEARPAEAGRADAQRSVPLPSLNEYILLHFLAPVTLQSSRPEKPLGTRYAGNIFDDPMRRSALKMVALMGLFRLLVLPHRALLAESLLLTTLVGDCVLYLFLSGTEDAACGMLERVFDVEMAASFNRPWLAQSSREFWARRWHLPFHQSIKAVTSRAPRRWLSAPAAAWLGFLYSGLSHVGQLQVTLHLLQPVSSTLCFFLAAALMASVEGRLLAALDQRVRAAWRPLARRVVVIGLLVALSPLYWHPFWEVNFLVAMAEAAAGWTL